MESTLLIDFLEPRLGFKTIFHDDYLDSFFIGHNYIDLTFRFLKINALDFHEVTFDKDRVITVRFNDISNLIMEEQKVKTDYTIILDLYIETKEELYSLKLYPSLGNYIEFDFETIEIAEE